MTVTDGGRVQFTFQLVHELNARVVFVASVHAVREHSGMMQTESKFGGSSLLAWSYFVGPMFDRNDPERRALRLQCPETVAAPTEIITEVAH